MICCECGKEVGDKEGFVGNVDRSGKVLSSDSEVLISCSEACCRSLERHLPMNGKPIMHMSRITGYMQVVENWNAGKQQEFLDRKRYSLEGIF
jgi:hypothetical protein